MKHNFSIYILLCTLFLGSIACQDDLLYKGGEIGEGESLVSATVKFKPLTPALNGNTRAAGNIIKSIKSLCVLMYNEEGKLLKAYPLEYAGDGVTTPSEGKYTLKDMDRSGDKKTESIGGENKELSSAESQTPHADFKLTIPYGRYRIYAVANISDLLTNENYSDAIQTIESLKSIALTWDTETIANNNQMFGYFTVTGSGQSDDLAVINQPSAQLHAWVRRAASKITIAYDGSQLKEGVFIYLQSVQIKDIPLQCYLGKDNNVGKEDYPLEVYPEESKESRKMLDGETIYYHEGDKTDDFEYGEECAGHRVTVGAPYFGSHDENAEALYFYENMQGAGDNMPDKRQDADKNGELDNPGLPNNPDKYPHYRPKDNVPYGTYIEVHAHYISNNSERLGNGHIIYRFMLGQDVEKDYNAKRNCHYKLTLMFKNFANEADWHIEYEEPEPGVMTPAPYYISYLYNHSMMYPIKVNTGGHKITSIKAEIIDNQWQPYNASSDVYYPVENELWNGFLSLHKTTQTVLDKPENHPDDNELNKPYYEQDPKRGLREYTEFDLAGDVVSKDFTTVNSREDDKYRVEKHPTEANTYNIYIPLYTRAKQMIIWSGYTGNNPYVAYQRKAVIRITTTLDGVNKPFINEVPIYQVRRIVNPKGIYRSSNNNSSFHVILKRLPGEEATKFVTFQSEGPWKAYIIKEYNGNGIELSETPGVSELVSDGKYTDIDGKEQTGPVIQGKTGSIIDFNVNFNTTGDDNHYAIIRVEYHNYTCQHLIFVRQGDKPDNLVEGGAKWYAMNMKTKSKLASTPLDEGSLFKFGNWDQPIDALSNKNSKSPWINVAPTDFHAPDNLAIAGTDDKTTWESITNQNASETFGNPSLPNANARVATYDDYWTLRSNDFIEQGYGVLYGDDATETGDDIETVYGYDYNHANEGRGMRGCFAYNRNTGKNLFFPIGASGYGHRKNSFTQSWGDPETINGVLRYATGRTKLYPDGAELKARPLFYDLYRRPGAIYWWNQSAFVNKERGNCLGWDINYFTFDFNFIGAGNLIHNDKSDACFIRCVEGPVASTNP